MNEQVRGKCLAEGYFSSEYKAVDGCTYSCQDAACDLSVTISMFKYISGS